MALVYLDWEGKGSLFLPAWGGSDSPGKGIVKERQIPTSDGQGPRSIAKSSAGLNPPEASSGILSEFGDCGFAASITLLLLDYKPRLHILCHFCLRAGKGVASEGMRHRTVFHSRLCLGWGWLLRVSFTLSPRDS